jgi:leucyl-tRNA synthetase
LQSPPSPPVPLISPSFFFLFIITSFVKSRTGEECVVAMTDQWYLKYGEEEWKAKVSNHVNDPTKFTPYSQEILDKFNFTFGWLNEWACSRLFGLGTQLPWDSKWVIESLSDSTIYMVRRRTG